MSRRSRRHRAGQRADTLHALATANDALQRARQECAAATVQIRRLAGERNTLQNDLDAAILAAAGDSNFKSRFIGCVRNLSIAHGVPTALDFQQIAARDRIKVNIRSYWSPDARLLEARDTQEVMRLLKIKVISDGMQGMVHCVVDFADQRAGYAISESTLRVSPADHIVSMIAPEIATRLAQAIKENQQHRQG